ncbi:hypothetical protein [Flavobacterium sp.]|uniref:hypothetical protein n=1 Tax=Flavobacterium sp. TaxID=239 RepID=UPI00286BCD89|nr:hypothetical protein [Flavobacterium sp.]
MKYSSTTLTNTSLVAYILIIPFLTAVYFGLTLPVSFDESCTFLLFTNKGLLETITHYPAPNNHVLFSILTHLTNGIPNISNLMRIRIPAIGIHLLTLISLYRFVATFFNRNLAVVVVCVSSLLFLNIYYSYMARGYGLINLCFVNCLYYSFKICNAIETRKSLILFGLFSVVGMYTIPTFIYPIVTLSVFIILVKPNLFWTQVKVGLCVLTLTSMLYAPIIYYDGLDSITGNSFVKPMPFIKTLHSIPLYYLNTIAEITGIHWSIVIILMGWSGYKILKSGTKIERYFTLIAIAAPAILLCIQRVNPYARVFNYNSFVFVLILFLPYQNQIKNLKLSTLLIPILIAQSLLLLHFNAAILKYEDKDCAINITSNAIIKKIMGNKRYLLNGTLLNYNLEFDLISKGFKNYQIDMPNRCFMNADTISNYDFVVTEPALDKTQKKKPLYQTEYYTIYGSH